MLVKLEARLLSETQLNCLLNFLVHGPNSLT